MTREKPNPKGQLLDFRPQPHNLAARVRKIATDKGATFSLHAWDRIDGREISDLDALRVLKFGEIKGEIEAGKNTGEWKCKMVAPRSGGRVMGVVTLVIQNDRLLVKTVEWEY